MTDDSTETSETDSESVENQKTEHSLGVWKYVIITFAITTIVIATLVSIAWYYFYTPTINDDENSRINNLELDLAREIDPSHVHLAHSLMNLEEGIKYCQKHKLSLITPLTQKTEIEVIKLIKNLSDTHHCTNYLFGYRATQSLRYKSLKNDEIWPSLAVSTDSVIPSSNKICVEIALEKEWRVVKDVSCIGHEVNCVLLLETFVDTECENHPFRADCVTISKPINALHYSVIDHFNIFKEHSPNVYGVLPIDPNFIPENIQKFRPFARTDKCYAISMVYIFQYKGVENTSLTKNYKSENFYVIDPEYNCLGIDTARDFKVVTMYCKNPACILCN